jgi:hypothetical protein
MRYYEAFGSPYYIRVTNVENKYLQVSYYIHPVSRYSPYEVGYFSEHLIAVL